MSARKKVENKIKNTVEYSVYIHLPANQNKRFWEKTSTTDCAELALEQAEMLYYSEKYPRVEVMKKYFCERRKKFISQSIRIFDMATHNSSPLSKMLRYVARYIPVKFQLVF